MVFQYRLFHLMSSALLVLSFCTANLCVAQDSDDDEISSAHKSSALIEWLKETKVEIPDDLKDKQARSAFMLTVTTKLIIFFAILGDYRQGDITLSSSVTAFSLMTAITYYSSKHLQRFDRLFTKPIPWKNLWPSFLKRKKPRREIGQLLTYKEMNPSTSAPFLDSLFRRGVFTSLSVSLLNLVYHTKNEVVNNSHAIWTQEGIFETASLVLAATFGSSMFHTMRNTFVKDPEKSEKLYAYTSIIALNLMALYQLGFHAAIPSTITGLPFNVHMTLVATYLTYAVGSVASMKEQKAKSGERQAEPTIVNRDIVNSDIKYQEATKPIVLPLTTHKKTQTPECYEGFKEANH